MASTSGIDTAISVTSSGRRVRGGIGGEGAQAAAAAEPPAGAVVVEMKRRFGGVHRHATHRIGGGPGDARSFGGERPPRWLGSGRDDLGEDRERHLFGGVRTDV